MLEFSNDQQRTMLKLQREIAAMLQRANRDKVEAAIAAFACIRLARELLDKYNPQAREALLEQAVIPFLRHAEGPDVAPSIIIVN
jgi:hypothetical protein